MPESGSGGNREPNGLVHCCQRVLIANINAIAGFGEDIPHRLIIPILRECNADVLLRFERETPHLRECTSEFWKNLCTPYNRAAAKQPAEDDLEKPGSWRDEFFRLREREAKRLEEAASRIRSQRHEAEELKRKRQVKITDRLPEPKRNRHGCLVGSTRPTSPKTLFEKTRKEATKFQKNIFGLHTLPPPVGLAKGFRAKLGAPSAQLALKNSEPVAVATVTVRSPCTTSQSSSPQTNRKPISLLRSSESSSSRPRSPPLPQREVSSTTRWTGNAKKDSITTLFLPRQRASSQLSHKASSSSKVLSR